MKNFKNVIQIYILDALFYHQFCHTAYSLTSFHSFFCTSIQLFDSYGTCSKICIHLHKFGLTKFYKIPILKKQCHRLKQISFKALQAFFMEKVKQALSLSNVNTLGTFVLSASWKSNFYSKYRKDWSGLGLTLSKRRSR